MKKHNLFKVVMITILLVVLGSWVLPLTSISGTEFVTDETTKLGLFNVVSFLSIAIQYFSHVALYVLVVGGLYGVLHKIPQYRVLLDKITSGFKGFEWLFMIIVGVVFAVLSSMAGLSLPLLFLFPFVISVILLMGYSKVTAAMLTVGSTIAGLIGSVFSSNDIYGMTLVLSNYAQEQGMEYNHILANGNVGWKILLLVVSLVIVLVNVILYARKHKVEEIEDDKKYVPEKVEVKNKKIYPLVVILDTVLVVLALGFISWDLFGVNLFNDITNRFTEPTGSAFTKGLFKAFNSLLGLSSNNTSYAFGMWTLLEASIVVFLGAWLLSFIYRKSFNEFLSDFAKGAKKAFKPACLVILAYVVLVAVTNVPVQLSVLRPIINLGGSNGVLVFIVVAIFYSIFAVESYYAATGPAQLIFAVAAATNLGKIALTWQSMYGLTMLVAPTSVLLLATLSHLKIGYGAWWKAVWKLFLELLIACTIILLLV